MDRSTRPCPDTRSGIRRCRATSPRGPWRAAAARRAAQRLACRWYVGGVPSPSRRAQSRHGTAGLAPASIIDYNRSTTKERHMAFELPALPYPKDALTPVMSAETLEYHYGKHHQAYVNNLNNLVPGTKYESMSLEEVVKATNGQASEKKVFNNAAQVWNHTFFWNSLAPNAGGDPSGAIQGAIDKSFGNFADFKKKFSDAAVAQFGSGWAWLVKNSDGSLAIETTSNAETPFASG